MIFFHMSHQVYTLLTQTKEGGGPFLIGVGKANLSQEHF